MSAFRTAAEQLGRSKKSFRCAKRDRGTMIHPRNWAKWQMDVKYVPKACYVGTDGEKFYQYTMMEEASRERFIYACKENSSYSNEHGCALCKIWHV